MGGRGERGRTGSDPGRPGVSWGTSPGEGDPGGVRRFWHEGGSTVTVGTVHTGDPGVYPGTVVGWGRKGPGRRV